jgi:hypothetical protein
VGNSGVMESLEAPSHRIPNMPTWGQAAPYGGDVRAAIYVWAGPEAVDEITIVEMGFNPTVHRAGQWPWACLYWRIDISYRRESSRLCNRNYEQSSLF